MTESGAMGPGVQARFGTTALRIGAAAAVLLAAACSSVPDELNPAEWYRGIVGEGAPADATRAGLSDRQPDPDAPYPNLASVPERPKPTMDPGQRMAMMTELERDRLAAQAADSAVREAAPAESPAPPVEAPAAETPAPAAAAPAVIAAPLASPPASETRTGLLVPPSNELPPPRRAEQEAVAVAPAPSEPSLPATQPVAAPAESTVAARPPVSPPAPVAGLGSPAPVVRTGRALAPRPPIQPPEPMSAPRISVS